MKEQLIGFETAKLAKEKGFKRLCDFSYDEDGMITGNCEQVYNFVAPTQSLLQKWLREKHKIHIELQCDSNYYKYFILIYYKTNCVFSLDDSLIYEEALEIGLQEALKLIE